MDYLPCLCQKSSFATTRFNTLYYGEANSLRSTTSFESWRKTFQTRVEALRWYEIRKSVEMIHKMLFWSSQLNSSAKTLQKLCNSIKDMCTKLSGLNFLLHFVKTTSSCIANWSCWKTIKRFSHLDLYLESRTNTFFCIFTQRY